MRNHEHELPSYRIDPWLYDDDVCAYLDALQELNGMAVASSKKPSLDEYDGNQEG